MTVHYVLSIPNWRPHALNELLAVHWAERNRMKRADREMIAAYWWEGQFPRAKGKRRVSLKIIYPKGKRRHDEDAFNKSTLDALVACGALKNDSTLWCEWVPADLVRGEELHTVIVLQDL